MHLNGEPGGNYICESIREIKVDNAGGQKKDAQRETRSMGISISKRAKESRMEKKVKPSHRGALEVESRT